MQVCCIAVELLSPVAGLHQGRFYQEPKLPRSRRTGLFLAGLAGPTTPSQKSPYARIRL